MSVLLKKLEQFQNEEIVVVMQDNRAFRGTLVEYDENCIVLRDVVEGLPGTGGGWEEPTVRRGVTNKVVTWQGVFCHEDNTPEILRLKDVVVQLSGVLRIWEFNSKNLATPEHTRAGTAEEGNDMRPGSTVRVTRRG